MKNLIVLRLDHNNLTRVIPSSLGYLIHLNEFNIGRNQISGHIPLEIGNLKNLATLDLSDNMMNGKMPFQLQNLKSLWNLNLSYNKLLGLIPILSIFTNIWSTTDLSHNHLEDHITLGLWFKYLFIVFDHNFYSYNHTHRCYLFFIT